MSRCLAWLCLLLSPSAFAQRGTGEFRLSVVDAAGAPMAARADLVSQATHTDQSVDLAPDGRYVFKNLPFGVYRLLVSRNGFVSSTELIEVRSELPQTRHSVISLYNCLVVLIGTVLRLRASRACCGESTLVATQTHF